MISWNNLSWNVQSWWTVSNLSWNNLSWWVITNLSWGNLTWWNSAIDIVANSLRNASQPKQTPVIQNLSEIQQPKQQAIITVPDSNTKSENPFKRSIWSKIFDQYTPTTSTLYWWSWNPIDESLAAAWEADQNKSRAKKIDWFSIDKYWIDNNNTSDLALDLSVESKEWWVSSIERNLGTWEERENNIYSAMAKRMWETWKSWTSIWDTYSIYKNALERQFPNIMWKRHVDNAVEDKFWDTLEFIDKEWTTEKHPSPLQHWYSWWDNLWLNLSIWDARYFYDSVEQWYADKEVYDDFMDAFYEKYKQDFTTKDLWAINRTVRQWIISRDAFERFVQNEWAKEDFRKSELERRWLPTDDDTEASRVSEAVKYEMSIIWPVIENSALSTVEYREEAMNDAYAAAYDFAWRMYISLYAWLDAKSWLQAELWVDNLWDLTLDEVPDRRKSMYEDIQRMEKNYNQFIKNHAEYIALIYWWAVDTETWRLDRIPEFVSDWANSWTYTQKIFDWIELKDNDTFLWWDFWMSPIDVVRQEARYIALNWDLETKWLTTQLWSLVQYWWAETLWAWYQELWQWMWVVPNKAWNILSWDSWEVPYEFLQMDSSILATLTTNDSNRWRLMQKYAVNTFEYWPELVAAIRQARLMDKWWEAIWTYGQVRALAALNRIPAIRNTVGWQQFAQWLAYSIRALQRLWTDQVLIDAPLSIYDTEFWSDFSKKLSLYWTLFWEWIWILSDLKALNRSVWMNFKKGWWADEIVDPIRLMANNDWILNDVAAHMWRGTVDESWKIVWDQYKLLIQDLSSYSKYLNKLSSKITDVITWILREWWNVDVANDVVKKAAHNVLKQVFEQNSAIAKVVTDLVTDWRANIADIVKYIWWIDWTVKIWPFISTIKVSDWMLTTRTAKSYNPWMDLVIDWWLVAWINRWLTKAEINELLRQWYIKSSDISAEWDNILNIEKYFAPYKTPDWQIRYYPTEEWLKLLWVDSTRITNPLAIATMSDDTAELINTLKKLPDNKRVLSDSMLDAVWETDAIAKLAENLANIKYLDICK